MLKRLAAALALPLLLAAPASAAVKASDVIGRAIDGFVRPAYASLDDRATSLTKTMHQLCAAPSGQNLEAARSDFSATVEAWSVAEIIAFGPVKENNRLERMLYWPDRKSIGLRQVQATLAAKDPSATDPPQLAGKSVAMQGLGALEYLLFGDGAETLAKKDDPYRCAYGAAVAGNIEMIAGEVRDAWNKPDGFASLWANPGPKNPLYRDGTEAVTELVGVFINELDMVRDVRLKGFLGAKPDADKPKQAIYWRSQNTATSLAGNLSGIDRLFQASKLGDALPGDAQWMAESIHIQLANGVATAKSVNGPIDKALADPALRGKLEHFALITSSLSTLIGTRMTAEFGLTAGFSSLDGD
ncbi:MULTISPECIES: imelysin family protein [unclassified Mesorhizobium]|uniref:imelysin family protein n=1 Tax=unclassified Mesorhizobium TaxID=325217 RepID=UPI000FCAB6F5|nr:MULTISPECIES: imelysin family protein [unclassified Mesorhizobium]RUW36750.1 peptidase M75, Imelysin [Mesorhizobium sp. M1E.F.Ca.ET.041.01.1.1]RWD89546.1 MAG: peptidase M75, Imelysin [Mesorhizobium sp.]RWD93069.1 MAG: peptidase M75, Imelysin [Mesorhizobium sp.]TIV51754.1 MAG: peptidase M75, Imelysin [Mesorhizobium sp.]